MVHLSDVFDNSFVDFFSAIIFSFLFWNNYFLRMKFVSSKCKSIFFTHINTFHKWLTWIPQNFEFLIISFFDIVIRPLIMKAKISKSFDRPHILRVNFMILLIGEIYFCWNFKEKIIPSEIRWEIYGEFIISV